MLNGNLACFDALYKWRMLSTAMDITGEADPDFILCCMFGC